jgi:hypothetical protein
MIERLTPKTETTETTTSTRAKAIKLFFREDVLARLPLATKHELHRIVWDRRSRACR